MYCFASSEATLGCDLRHKLWCGGRAGLPHELGFHCLRHTYAGGLIAGGLHPRVIMARLGHASIEETMNTYGHLFPDSLEQTTEALDRLFG